MERDLWSLNHKECIDQIGNNNEESQSSPIFSSDKHRQWIRPSTSSFQRMTDGWPNSVNPSAMPYIMAVSIPLNIEASILSGYRAYIFNISIAATSVQHIAVCSTMT